MKYIQMPPDVLPIFHNSLGGDILPWIALVDQPSIDYGAWHGARPSYARHAFWVGCERTSTLAFTTGDSFVFLVFLCLDLSAQQWETSADLVFSFLALELPIPRHCLAQNQLQ